MAGQRRRHRIRPDRQRNRAAYEMPDVASAFYTLGLAAYRRNGINLWRALDNLPGLGRTRLNPRCTRDCKRKHAPRRWLYMWKRWLISGAVVVLLALILWLVPSSVRAWIGAQRDAGDWIAFGALVIALFGWWQSRVSARAARDSARVAEQTLPLADKSAEAAVESAHAAHRSADVAEAVRHREEAPQWDIKFEHVEDGICVVVAQMLSGPAAIDVYPFYSGQMWGLSTPKADSIPGTVVANQLETVRSLHKGGHVRFPLRVPSSIGEPSSITLTIVLPSVDSRRAELDPQAKAWDYAETVRWRAAPTPFVMFGD